MATLSFRLHKRTLLLWRCQFFFSSHEQIQTKLQPLCSFCTATFKKLKAFREGVLISPQSLFDYLHVTRLREINTLSLLKNNLGYSLSGQA